MEQPALKPITGNGPQFVDEPDESKKDSGPSIIVLKFADSKIPVFKESRNKDYIKYGEDNVFPEYLTYLFNKSAKHNAIITGKANYIFGNGYENGDFIINRNGESLNDISRKANLDGRIYGGYKLEVIWNRAGKIAEIYHVDYNTIRKGKDGGFWFKETWDSKIYNTPDEIFIPAFDPAHPQGSQIFEYNEYRPGVRHYPLPDYIGCNNYIETDIEISKFNLSGIRNGMMPSKMIQFYMGEPTNEKKRDIENRFAKKFAGAENAGRFIMVFNTSKDKTVDINDLSASELDKMYAELNKTCQQEIFSGHLVTSPMLFGIKTEGQLGGNTELKNAYTLFQNTYSKPKAKEFDREMNWLLSYSIFPGKYELRPTDPIGFQFDIKDVVSSLPKTFVFKELGIPEELWEDESIEGSEGLVAPEAMSNENIKNLTGRQHQQIKRIIREYNKEILTEAQAKTLLKTGLGLSEEDINSLLGIQVFSKQLTDDEAIEIYDQYGESKDDFEIIKSKKVHFSKDECSEDEEIFIQEAFKTLDVTLTEKKILDLIEKDPLITDEIIAQATKQTVAFIKSRIKSLTSRGYIETEIKKIGGDEILRRLITEGKKIIPPTKKEPVQIFIKYSYEGPNDSRNRPFCKRLLELNRLYSRHDIEKMSERLGYSVFDRRGGFYRHPNGETTPYCRHRFMSHIVIKKGGAGVS